MSFRYAVLGGGRQGTAAAYDLAVRGAAERVLIVDRDAAVARGASERVNRLVGRPLAAARALDVTDHRALVGLLAEIDSLLSAVPYWLNLQIAQAAIEAGAHMCDLGGNTELVRRQLELHESARAAGISLIPDCGQVPGMGTSLMAYTLELLDEPEGVTLWDGGIPQQPQEPWNYALTFNIAGLTNEYFGTTTFLREGRLCEVECFDPAGYEVVEFPAPFGRLEAFVTAGGTSTAPWTYLGKLRYLENRTLRYPGHAAQWQAYRDAGLLELEPVAVGGTTVVPRDLLHTLLGPRLVAPEDYRDAVIVRTVATGRRQGRRVEAQVDLVDFFDEETGFTAMQRTTGWDGAIVAAMMARGETPAGAVPRETSIDRQRYVEELGRRGLGVEVEIRSPV